SLFSMPNSSPICFLSCCAPVPLAFWTNTFRSRQCPIIWVALDGGVAFSKGVGHILAAVSEQLEDLSERECAIVSYLLAGKRQKEVATALGISERTVHTHLRRLYKKRGVRSWKSLVQKIVAPHGPGQV